MSESKTPNVQSLFQSAKDEGALSPKSMQVLNVPDLGAQIQAGLGVNVDDVPASAVTLVSLLFNDSGSIRFGQNAQIVRDGGNLVIQSLKESKQKEGILAHARYLNGTVLYPYVPLEAAVPLDSQNYNPNGGTPLYDQTVVMLGTVLAKAQEFAENGVACRTVTLIVTDGADCGSYQQTAAKVAAVVKDMLKSETHIIAAMGIDDGGATDFRQVFSEMGIPDEWILVPGNNEKDIRRAFQLVSQSAVRASQAGANFSQVAMGGFGKP